MDNSWQIFIEQEFKKEYMVKLRAFISEREKSVNIYPNRKLLFRPFDLCRYQMVKVVIVGGDPYPSHNSDGLAFSTASEARPATLEHIYEEVLNDYFQGNTGKVNAFQTNRLDGWADQGVLLLNSCLTIEQDGTSHKGKGWESFITNLLTWLSADHPHHMCFLFWGNQAQQYSHLINRKKHLVLETEHPGSAGRNQSNWYGNKHFSKANEFIKKHYYGQKAEISWGVWKDRQN